jgi:uncharacterized membrane protein
MKGAIHVFAWRRNERSLHRCLFVLQKSEPHSQMKERIFMMWHRHEHHCGYGQGWAHAYPSGYEHAVLPGMFLSTLSTVLWIALLALLAWALWKWISPYILPIFGDMFDETPGEFSALEILRQRYAAGEIDAVTFEQMRERLEASYRSGEQPPPF